MGRIGFIGAGNMGRALAHGLITRGERDGSSIMAADASPAATAAMAEGTGIQTVGSNRELAEACTTVVIAVKPAIVPAVLREIAPALTSEHVVISIAAGVTLARMREALGSVAIAGLVRAMPNTPALVGEGMTVWCSDGLLDADHAGPVTELLSAVGRVRHVDGEGLLDAVTGLSGSGPAYVFLVLEALSDAGVREGLPRDLADELAVQTVLGAATLASRDERPFAALKAQVTPPGGTTIAGVAALERGGLRAALFDAVRAATARSKELS